MGIAASVFVEAQFVADLWADFTADTNAAASLWIKYGVQGGGPLDCVAGSGEASFELRNSADNSGEQQGYYSPQHASKRAGWTFGIPLQVVFAHGSDSALSVASITRAGTTATVTTDAAHGRATGDYVKIAGAAQAEYNGTRSIAVTGAATFTITVSSGAVTPATGTITARRVRVKHRGKVSVIDPDAGEFDAQRVRVIGYDGMRDLATADLRSVDLQIDKSEAELVEAVLDALPAASQPVARDLDTGVDTYPYAFYEVGNGEKALGVLAKVAINAFAFVAMKGDGTLILRSRTSRAVGTSAYTFANTMHGLTAPSTPDQVFNVVRTTIHPKTVDAAATTVVYSATGTPPVIEAGATMIVWADYRDPANTTTLIGARDVVDPLVSGTDYAGNSQADGLGTNLSASLGVTIEPFASTAKITIINNHATLPIYLTDSSGVAFLQVRGKGIYDRGPQTYEASTVEDYGTQPLSISLDYQSDPVVAQSYATYVQALYRSLASQASTLAFIANDSADFLTQALDREPGDTFTISEPVTGLTLVTAVIQSVELEVSAGPWIVCRWRLAPSAPFQSWVLGSAGRSELGATTTLGF